MYRDGICRLTDKLYTKTVQFFDINYQLAQADDKAQIFEGYCDFLNYFDASIHVQLTFINQRANMQDFARSIDIPIRGDEYDGIRREYGDMLKSQLQKGNNGLTKRKYITFGIEADDLRTAKMRLERIEADVLANFKALGAQAKPLDGWIAWSSFTASYTRTGRKNFILPGRTCRKPGSPQRIILRPPACRSRMTERPSGWPTIPGRCLFCRF